MQKGLIGILGVLVLFLAAVNVRLSTRARLLEEQLATAPRRPASPSAPGTPEPVVQAPSVPAPAAVVKTSEPKRADPGPAPVSVPQQKARLEEARLLEQRVRALQAMAAPAS